MTYFISYLYYVMTAKGLSVRNWCDFCRSFVCFSGNATEESMGEYFPRIIETLKIYLEPTEDEDATQLQIQSVGK